jgi:putative PIN family toxin of toxin-antitoxin system
MIVFDSGIWISALQFGGTPAAAIGRAVSLRQVVYCAKIHQEILSAFERKFGVGPQIVETRLLPFVREALWVEVTRAVRGVCRDPNDDFLLECALKAEAQLIVTGDKDLLTLREFRGIRIITARQYLDLPQD